MRLKTIIEKNIKTLFIFILFIDCNIKVSKKYFCFIISWKEKNIMQNTMTETENIKNIVKERNLQHIAIIMDGNRRWAKKKMLPSAAGHKKGVEALRSTLKACAKFDVKYLTVYAFSTENWNRDKEEVEFLMSLLAKTIVKEVPEFIENDIKLTFIGD